VRRLVTKVDRVLVFGTVSDDAVSMPRRPSGAVAFSLQPGACPAPLLRRVHQTLMTEGFVVAAGLCESMPDAASRPIDYRGPVERLGVIRVAVDPIA
jgi:hypothetical protein